MHGETSNVEAELCITCRAPEHEASSLIGFYDGDSAVGDHCYFKKQPETPHESDLALKAVRANCCGSYRYAGPDPEVKAKLREQGDMDAIDSP
jgi:hypothetical protein